MLNQDEQEKYSRQIIMKEIGVEGQKKLKRSTVAIVGVGALGTNSAELLARAGVGKIILIDEDIIEQSNLQRQTLFDEEDVGKSKVEVARTKLEKINSLVDIEIYKKTINKNNIDLLKKSDLVLDCTDNLETRFLINKFCQQKKPWIYAACVKTEGYVMPILPNQPCLGCFLNKVNLDSSCTIGILNSVPSSIAALQTTIAIKLLLNQEVKPILFYYNLWNQEFRKLNVKKNPLCKCS
jgi:molybdopterin-synthase adenylyltransferase